MKILVVEPFHTGSHRSWAEGYRAHSGHDVRLLTHPGRWWKWRKLVASCHIVVSTALQEFFGIAVVEAIAAGCRPVLPLRLSYPWLIPEQFHDLVLYPDGGLTEALAQAVDDPSAPPGLAESMHRFSWTMMAPEYDRRLAEIVDR